MFKKLIERIDAINDYVNPIVVRDIRKGFGNRQMSVFMIFYACILIAICLCVYFLCDLNSLESNLNKAAISFDFWKALNNDIVFLFVFLCIFAAMSDFVVFGNFCQHFLDEMFLITTITPRQYLHAYIIETFILTSFYMSLSAPVILMILGQRSNFLALAVIMLCGSVLIAQTSVLIALSFFARLKNLNKNVNTNMGICSLLGGIIGLIMVGIILLLPLFPWIFLALVWTSYFHWQAINANNILGFVSIYILLPIGLLFICAIGYKLSLYGFKTRGKLIERMFFFNIFCYTLLSVVLALIYFCIAFVVFNFL
jgi:hypothetical protein